MEPEKSSVRGESSIGDVEKSTNEILTTVFEKLSSHASLRADPPPRLFFPNGIELISVKVVASPSAGIDIEVQIAGEKGIKPSKLSGLALAGVVPSGPPTIRSINPPKVPLNWAGPVNIYGTGFDDGSFALFDANVPETLRQSADLLVVQVTSGITAERGTKSVLVHTAAGDESNSANFEVG